jgi:hypothetical protein
MARSVDASMSAIAPLLEYKRKQAQIANRRDRPKLPDGDFLLRPPEECLRRWPLAAHKQTELQGRLDAHNPRGSDRVLFVKEQRTSRRTHALLFHDGVRVKCTAARRLP